jgi:hypothetical protein
MNGEYKEKLPFGTGDLIVTKDTFYIEFYFSGPDLRHNGTFKRINKDEIDLYIKAYKENWKKYEELQTFKEKIGGEFTTVGQMNMQITIGGWRNGVCIDSYHLPLRSEKEISSLIDSFNWAKKRGSEIMKLLVTINSL